MRYSKATHLCLCLFINSDFVGTTQDLWYLPIYTKRERGYIGLVFSLGQWKVFLLLHTSYNPGDWKRWTASGKALPLSPCRSLSPPSCWMEIACISSSPERNSVFRRLSYSISLTFILDFWEHLNKGDLS
jgi:hypothetical protein